MASISSRDREIADTRMTETQQLGMLRSHEMRLHVTAYIKDMLANALQPSARELVAELACYRHRRALGPGGRFGIAG